MGGGSVAPIPSNSAVPEPETEADGAFVDNDMLCDGLAGVHLYPKLILNTLPKRSSAEQMEKTACAVEHLCQALQETGLDVSVAELDEALSSLAVKKQKLEAPDGAGSTQMRLISEFNYEEFFHHPNLITSMEFDRDENLLAVAGTSRKIMVLDFDSVINAPEEEVCPVAEMPNGSKLSCVSWNKSEKNHIASSDYDGAVTVWDVTTCQGIMKFTEHEKRAWSVDFSDAEPSMLVSGSDDCTVKIWSTVQQASVINIGMKANVCSVKYNPASSNHLAVGSADHNIYYYDLRNISHPIHILRGHAKAVSYVKFSSASDLVSASTDSTLRLWDLNSCSPKRVFRGHVNTKNFTGLAVSSRDHTICGSETNEVFLYDKDLSSPIAWHSFASPLLEDDTGDGHNAKPAFVSDVCWKGDGATMVAANNRGMVRVLSLDP